MKKKSLYDRKGESLIKHNVSFSLRFLIDKEPGANDSIYTRTLEHKPQLVNIVLDKDSKDL
tara:strand:- start:2339 stop:2521 length:183 start_codon:yes stop_codon:yes gene_type:complete